MRRSLWIRVVTAMWAVWLGVALSEPMMMHPCAMHGDVAAQMAGMPGMGGTQADGQAATAHHDGTPVQGTGTTCTCLSDCCCAPAMSVPVSARTDVAGAAAVEYATIAPSCDVSVPVAALPYAQPFANGPPATLSI